MAQQARDRFWFNLHNWVGLKLSIFMSFILITGTLAVFSNEIDWVLNPEMRATQAVAQPDWGAALDTLRAEYPHVAPISLDRPTGSWFAVQAVLTTPWEEIGRLWFDPATGKLNGSTAWFNVQRFFRMTHRHLMLPTPIGVPIVTALAIPLLISMVSGLIIYKKFWLGWLRWPRTRRKARIWLGDLHRLLGLWSVWFVFLISVTSIWYFIEMTGGAAPRFPASPPATERLVALPESLNGAMLNQMVNAARAELPGLDVKRIVLPGNESAKVIVQGDLSAVLVRPRANAVAFDPLTGNLLGSYRGEDLGLHQRISEAADPLHFGYFGGYWTKVIWFLFGCAMCTLSISGCVIYAKRLLPKQPNNSKPTLTSRPI
ncbi:MAG: PepSY-associated TM helix domain-containing protein [Pseudomonadota bacterium]